MLSSIQPKPWDEHKTWTHHEAEHLQICFHCKSGRKHSWALWPPLSWFWPLPQHVFQHSSMPLTKHLLTQGLQQLRKFFTWSRTISLKPMHCDLRCLESEMNPLRPSNPGVASRFPTASLRSLFLCWPYSCLRVESQQCTSMSSKSDGVTIKSCEHQRQKNGKRKWEKEKGRKWEDEKKDVVNWNRKFWKTGTKWAEASDACTGFELRKMWRSLNIHLEN